MSLKVGYETVPSEAQYYFEAANRDYTLRATTALYDPIFTPLFTAILGTSFAATQFGGLVIAGLSAIATTALSIGIQALLAPTPPKPEDGKVPKVQSIPYRQWGVGRNRVAGAYMLWEAKGRNLYSVQAIAGHRIQAINRFWLHDDEVTIDPVTGVTQMDDDGRYGNNVTIGYRLGLPTETPYANIVTGLSGDGVWTNNHRGDGQASLSLVAQAAGAREQPKRFPYGPPSLSVEADMALCWDFRDPLQDPEDQSTWTWTRNAAVIMAWHQCFNEFGHRRDYRRAILPVLDMWQEEADVCDDLVALAGGGFERRYECNGFDTTENDPKAATNAILASCDGWICERGDGALLFIVGKFREKYVTTLTDADLVGHQIEYDVLFEDECNRLIPKFCYPEIGYGTSDTDFFEDTDAQIVAGRVLAQDANYQWVQQWRQARRLGIRDWRRLQEKISGQLNVRLSGINSVYSRWVRLNTPIMLPRLNGKLIENRKSVLSLLQGGFTMDVMKHPDNIDDWNPVTDEGQQPPVPPKPNADDVVTPVINLVQARANGNTVYLRVVIIDPDDDSLTPIVRYRVTDNGSGNPGAWVEQEFPDAVPDAGFVELATQTVPVNQELEVQVLFMASDGDRSDPSVTVSVTSTADPVAPQSLQSFVVTDSAPHLGRVEFDVTTKNDARVRTVDIYRVATGGTLDLVADTPVASIAVGPSATYGFTDGDDTRVNLLTNGGFDTDTAWTKGTNWTISGGVATKVPPSSGQISQAVTLVAGTVYRIGYTIVTLSASLFAPVFLGGTTAVGVQRTTAGSYIEKLTALTGNTSFGVTASATTNGSIDDVILYAETASCAPQGVWDYYAVPMNGSGVAGPDSGPVTVTII